MTISPDSPREKNFTIESYLRHPKNIKSICKVINEVHKNHLNIANYTDDQAVIIQVNDGVALLNLSNGYSENPFENKIKILNQIADYVSDHHLKKAFVTAVIANTHITDQIPGKRFRDEDQSPSKYLK